MAKSGVSFKVTGLKEALEGLKASKREIEEAAAESVEKAALNIQLKAKVDAPKDLGRLAGSIFIEESKVPGIVDFGVVVPVKYAPFVEWGTLESVNVPEELKNYAIQFKGAGKNSGTGMPARPFLFPAYFAERPKIVERIIKKLKK